MRYSTFVAGFFAAGVFATPALEKRVYETKVHMVTVYETVTAGAEQAAAPTTTPCSSKNAVAAPSPKVVYHYGNHRRPGHRRPGHKRPVQKPKYQPVHKPKPRPQKPNARPAPLGGATDYKGICLQQHNMHRRNHSAPDLVWDDGLAAAAAEVAASCVYAHNTEAGGGGYGQNIAAGVKAENVGVVITNLFYNNELMAYPFGGEPSMENFHVWGHLSQLVWVATTKVGCATQYCPGGLANAGGNVPPYFTVCNYAAAGNMAGAYAENVRPPRGDAICVVDEK